MCVDMKLQGYPPERSGGFDFDRSSRPGPTRALPADLLPDHLRPEGLISFCFSGSVEITNIEFDDDIARIWVDGSDPFGGFGSGYEFERQEDGSWLQIDGWGWQA